MKKIFLTFLLFYFSNLLCQNRFIYQYNFIPDVSKKDSVVTDLMSLDFDSKSKQSNFYSVSKKISDSLTNIIVEGNPDKINLPKYNPNLNYSISKDLKNNKIEYHVKYSGIKMKIPENENPMWSIRKEQKIISTFLCQKATATYKGRDWVAWFANDIAINDGPYKFHGLPGLIIEIGDTKNEHTFKIIQTQNDKSIKINTHSDDEKIITTAQLNKLFDEGAANVNQRIKAMYMGDTGFSFILNDGNVLQLDKNTNDIEKELSKQSKRLTNPIEKVNK